MNYFCRNMQMNRLRKILVISCLTIGFALISPLGFGQISDPSCDPLDPTCPIDGGVSLLIAAGVGLGARKAYLHKKREKQA